jgi:hypothetical protein
MFEQDILEKYSNVIQDFQNSLTRKMDLVCCDSCNQMIQRKLKKKFFNKNDHIIKHNPIIIELNLKKKDEYQFC